MMEKKVKEMQTCISKNSSFESSLYDVDDVCNLLSIKKSKAYYIIKKLNQELNNDGYITVSGKVSKKYFNERVAI